MKKLLITIALLFSSTVFAENVNEIMKKASQAAYYQGNDGVAQMLMKVYSKGSSTPIKKLFYMLRKNIKGSEEQLMFAYFMRPSDIAKTTFLVHKYIDKDDYRRLYIPASDKVLPIAGSRKQDPFMGSDFSYEDVSGRHYTKDTHSLKGSATINGEDCYQVSSVAKDKDDKVAKINSWISKKTYIPMKVEFYNKEGKLFKIYESQTIQKIGNYPTIINRIMTSPLDGTKTEMLVNPKSVKYDVGLQDSDFTERSLKNPPMNYMK